MTPQPGAATPDSAGINQGADPVYVLRLYIAGQSSRSMKAVDNLGRFIKKYVPDADVEIIDVYQQREMATEADVIGAPTLVRRHPLPLRRIMGDLSNESGMATSLGLALDRT